jgi:hypothetical protein
MLHRKFFTAVMLFICLVVSVQSVYAAKSVFVINAQDYSGIQAYLIQKTRDSHHFLI